MVPVSSQAKPLPSSTEGIYQGLKRMLDSPELRTHYAQQALIRGRDFSKEHLVKQTEDFFEELLK